MIINRRTIELSPEKNPNLKAYLSCPEKGAKRIAQLTQKIERALNERIRGFSAYVQISCEKMEIVIINYQSSKISLKELIFKFVNFDFALMKPKRAREIDEIILEKIHELEIYK